MNTLKTAFLLAAAATAAQVAADTYTPFTGPVVITTGSPTYLMLAWDPSNGFRQRTDGETTVMYFSPQRASIMGDGMYPASVASGFQPGAVSTSLTTLSAGTVINSNAGYGTGGWNPSDGLHHAYFGISYTVSEGNYNYGWVKFSNVGLTFTVENAYMDAVVNEAVVIPGNGVANIASWMSSIDGAHRTYNSGVALGELPMEGAHHRPMMSFDRMGKDSQAWATGDFGTSSRLRDSHISTGEVGVNWNVGKTGLFGFAAGHGEQNEDLALGGSSNVRGEYALAEYDFRPEGTQWIFSAVAMVGDWNARLARCYDNSGSTDTSLGQTGLNTRSLRLRVDAPSVASLGGFSFAPYASYTVTHTSVDAFTETGGGFPASFNEQKHNAIEARLGVNASKDLSEQTKLILSFEGIHRFDGAGPSLSGQDITGSVAFSLPGTAPRPDCVRLGFDVDHKLNANTLLNFSAHASSVGEVSDFSCALSIRRAF